MNWQLALTLICVGAAIFVIARRVLVFARSNSSGGCGSTGCGHCPTSDAPANLGQPKPFVSLESLHAPLARGSETERTTKN